MRPPLRSRIGSGLALLSLVLIAGVLRARTQSRPFTVAAAASLQGAFTELGRQFEREKGQKVTFSFGSTGNLAKQIQNGAPFDLFAAADEERVAELDRKGFLASGTRRLYAAGRIVLATNRKHPPVRSLRGLLDPRVRRVAIANPELAPYGLAAREALVKAGVWERLKGRVVMGENIRQALQFVQTGNAEAGIVALSTANVPEITFTMIDARLHAPIRHSLAIVRGTPNEATARAFSAYVLGPRGQAVLKKYGFQAPRRVGPKG